MRHQIVSASGNTPETATAALNVKLRALGPNWDLVPPISPVMIRVEGLPGIFHIFATVGLAKESRIDHWKIKELHLSSKLRAGILKKCKARRLITVKDLQVTVGIREYFSKPEIKELESRLGHHGLTLCTKMGVWD